MRLTFVRLFMLLLAGSTGYLLIGGVGNWWGLVAVGWVGALVALYGHLRRVPADRPMDANVHDLASRLPWRQGAAVQDAQRNRRLERLLSKARFLATTCRDSYGARTYCMEIIRLTRQEDPLFVQAFDLYMHTVTTPRRRPPRTMPSGLDVSSPVMRDNVIPFPLNACRN